ncbi:MAG: TIGR02147 family protein [Bacteroidales bacterium]|uniref:TIGR02147 family protein n=1 Tax=Fibrobacter sp. TaxID=35828 RepID=UPI001B08CC3A|nr:TIGR02147 family protein [Fibrobacter sp.]MBO7061148.1 TIGR02147 family protein [Fibrobacter sp.]MBO7617664.1 TIGR02147 family protein [Bacteroidales bacterium]
MKEIVEYTDYRKYIQDYYDERKRCSAFSWQEFARNAGFSSAVFLKYVCEGKKNLSIGSAGSVANAMGLAGYEQAYFVLMVSYAHAKSDKAKRAAFEERCALAKAHKVHVLGDEEFDYFKSWKNSVIRELAPHMPGAKPLEIAKACKPKITAAEVSETLDFLVKAKLLKKDRNGNYHQTDKAIKMAPVEAVPLAARDLQRQMGEFAIQSLNLPLSERVMSGYTLGLTSRAFERIKKETEDYYRRVVAIATEDDETEQVYRLNVQLFPMSERLGTGKKCVSSKEDKNEKGCV